MAAVDEDRQLDALGTAVVEERLDRGANRPPRVEHVVDEDDGLALEREVERGRAHDRLRVKRSAAAAHLDVVAVEGDVDGTDVRRGAGAFLDEAPQALGDRHAPRLDPDESDAREVRVGLDDLVRDPRERAAERIGVEQNSSGRSLHRAHNAGRVDRVRAGRCI